MTYDFQREKFSLKYPTHVTHFFPLEVVKVAEALQVHKVKLGATFARMRVKRKAKCNSQLILDQQVRQRFESAEASQCSARINHFKENCMQYVISRLMEEGVACVQTKDQLLQTSFYQAERDLIIFSSDCRPYLYSHHLVLEGFLILQV